MNKPEVTRKGILDMQVCVPMNWIDEQVLLFAENENTCGTKNGWHIRKEGDKYLNGSHERVQCEERVNYVHIMLDC